MMISQEDVLYSLQKKFDLGQRVNSKPGQPTKRWVVKRSRGVGGEVVGDREHLMFRNCF